MQISDNRYEEIKSIVADIYYEYGIINLPVDPLQLAKKMQIAVNEYDEFSLDEQDKMRIASEDGFSYMLTGEPRFHINYNFDTFVERTRFTLAHEIGHIVLGHKEPSRKAEAEADAFAQLLLVPEAVLIYLNIQELYQVCSIFSVSKKCAQTCLSLLRVRKARKPIGYSESEKVILKQLNYDIQNKKTV